MLRAAANAVVVDWLRGQIYRPHCETMKVRTIRRRVGGWMASAKTYHRQFDAEMAVWDQAAPIGREFGGLDFDRLMALDAAALEMIGDWKKVREWLDTPNPKLDSRCPEAVAHRHAELREVMAILGSEYEMGQCVGKPQLLEVVTICDHLGFLGRG